MEQTLARRLARDKSEDSPVEFVVVESDVSVSDASTKTPEKTTKTKRSGLSFKKLRSNAQRLIPGRGKKESTSKPISELGSSSGKAAVVDEIPATPPPPSPPPASPKSNNASFDMALKSTESLPAIKEDPVREAALLGTRSAENTLDEGKDRQREKKARKPSRAASFMKKLAGRSKSSKVAPNPTGGGASNPEGDEISSGTLETPLSIKRQTPEGAMLGASENELYHGSDGDGTSVDPPSPVLVRQLESEPRALRAKRTEMKITLTRSIEEPTLADNGDESEGNDNSNGRLRRRIGDSRFSTKELHDPIASAKPISVVGSAQVATSATIGAVVPSTKESTLSKGTAQQSVEAILTQQRPIIDSRRLSSLLSGDYIAEINKFSIEKSSNGPPQPTPRGSLSIRDQFFRQPADSSQGILSTPPPPPPLPPSSVAVDEETDDFMRKSKGANAARSRAGNKNPGAVVAPAATDKEGDNGGEGVEEPTAASTVRTQEAAKPYQLGNSLKNPNNSGFKSIELLQQQQRTGVTVSKEGKPKKKGEEEKEVQEEIGETSTAEPAIVFDIGTQVRPDRTSSILKSGSTTTTLAVPPLSGGFTSLASGSRSLDELVGGSCGSFEDNSQTNNTSEGSLRRIAYVEQPTFCTPEEEELLTGKPPRSSSSLLSSGILESGEYSELESAGYLESSGKMSPHGDLLLEKLGAADQSASMATAQTEKREHLYKILVIGELGTGKTSFIKRYVHQFFSQNYRATIGVDFALKVLNWDQNTIIRLQLWDIAGQERFGNMTRVYYKEAVGAFIVFDVTRSATFDAVIKWKQDLDSKVQLPDGKPIPCILLANKSDQQKQGIVTTPAKLDEYVKDHGFAGWFETSAKENVNIEEAAKSLVNKILMNDKLVNTGEVIDSERFALAGGKIDVNQKKSCAC